MSPNEALISLTTGHAIDLSQYSNSVVKKIIAVLNRSDDRLYAELVDALSRINPSTFSVERLKSLLGSVRALNARAYSQAEVALRLELLDFARYEASYQAEALASVLPATVHVATVTAEVAYAGAMSRPFQGFLLKEFFNDLEVGKAKKIRQTIAQGFVESRTTDQIVRNLRGTKAASYADGLMAGTRRDVEAVTRTALGHMAGFVQDRNAEANADIIKAVQWSSTIDLRTSETCIIRDGKLYTPVGHEPIGHSLPWLSGPSRAHWNCRSAQVIVLKSYKELGIPIPESANLKSDRASMDGPIDQNVTYPQWLEKQSAERQDEVLGATRGKLLRAGGLEVKDMYSQKGIFLDLPTLKERNARAFSKAKL